MKNGIDRLAAFGFLLMACAAFLMLTSQARAAGDALVALDAAAGDGQIGLIGQPFAASLVARVTDQEGMPVAGATVHFYVDMCASTGDPSLCPLPSAYPAFANDQFDAVATSDANGAAIAPQMIAGDIVGQYRVVAAVFADDPAAWISAQAFFDVTQADRETVPIASAFSGAWYDPNQSGHGLLIEVLPGSRMMAYWFAFTPDGTQQAWFGGVGNIAGNVAVITAEQGQGGRWIPNFDPALYTGKPWGTLTFTFADCDHGRVDFAGKGDDSPWGTNHMDLTRITQPAGLSCP